MNSKEKISDLFNPTFAEQYEAARRIGEARFGSECKHESIKNGVCTKCLRKVYQAKTKGAAD
jgi:hypothetical protein